MSFNNFDDLEAQGADARSLHYKDFPDFETLSQQIESTLYNINNNQISALKSLNSQYEALLESADDNKSASLNKLSNKLKNLTDKINGNYKIVNENTQKINNYLNECEANHEDDDTLSYLRQKESLLIKLIKSSLKTYQTNQKRYELLQQKTLDSFAEEPSTDPSTEPSTEPTSSQIQITYEPVNAEELEQQTLMIQEREREIEQISQDITYINDIYGNLEDIVHEQQFAINTIEDNILRYNDDVQGAAVELRRADRYQRRSGGRMLCCLFILLGILGFIILISVLF